MNIQELYSVLQNLVSRGYGGYKAIDMDDKPINCIEIELTLEETVTIGYSIFRDNSLTDDEQIEKAYSIYKQKEQE